MKGHSPLTSRRAVRQLVRACVACPFCGAKPGQRCFTVRPSGAVYVRAASHMERWEAYRTYEAAQAGQTEIKDWG